MTDDRRCLEILIKIQIQNTAKKRRKKKNPIVNDVFFFFLYQTVSFSGCLFAVLAQSSTTWNRHIKQNKPQEQEIHLFNESPPTLNAQKTKNRKQPGGPSAGVHRWKPRIRCINRTWSAKDGMCSNTRRRGGRWQEAWSQFMSWSHSFDSPEHTWRGGGWNYPLPQCPPARHFNSRRLFTWSRSSLISYIVTWMCVCVCVEIMTANKTKQKQRVCVN